MSSRNRWERRRRLCAWFGGCGRGAVGVVDHPMLGEVPVCQRCGDFSKRRINYYNNDHEV